MYIIGVDVGGTFTDLVLSDGTATWRAKAPTDPADFSCGVISACRLVADQMEQDLESLLARVVRFGLGTTAVTNALTTREGQKVGFLTTAGFEGHLHAARGSRINVAGWLTMPWIPLDRRAVAGLAERIDRNGVIRQPLSTQDVEAALRELRETHGVQALAVSLLWSCRNPTHEKRVGEIAARLYPDMFVFLGSDLHPLMREYERSTMAVLNAFAAGALEGVEQLESSLQSIGLRMPLLLQHSGGGATSVREARAAPLGLASSGPASGAVAAAEVAKLAGFADALCCDMGGTSTDVAVVRDGVAERQQQLEIGGITTGQSAVDVESIGAGGGSIAWIDARGALRVGPQSARAHPGPVCYGRGGVEPTVTDAMVVLGYLKCDGLMGGSIRLDSRAALEACGSVGKLIGLDAIAVAHGIREIALAEMAKAIRSRMSKGGLDARRFALVSFGGSGSLFAPTLARQIGFQSIITPYLASVLSAYGAAVADVRREKVSSIDRRMPTTYDIHAEVQRLRGEVNRQLTSDGVAEADRSYQVEADLRLARQRSVLTLTVEAAICQETLMERFQSLYATRYGPGALAVGTPIELAALRVIGVGHTPRATFARDRAGSSPAGKAKPEGSRSVWLTPSRATDVPVFLFDQLSTGERLMGPALIDALDTTFWVPPELRVEMRPEGSLIGKDPASAQEAP